MYNLNVNLATSAVNSLLAVENACTTPRTPEILNSLIAMTNPLDNYSFGNDAPKTRIGPLTSLSNDSNSSSCSQLESPTNAPPSIQHTCSQLIKAGLKLSIEQKRKYNGDSEDLLDLDNCKRIKKSESESDEKMENGLTVEDEERRRRRRERNKIAATKCRLKKRERTANLVHESEILEAQNIDYKSQVQELQNQRRQLFEMLSMHRPQCTKNIQPATRDSLLNRLPPMSSLSTSVIELNHSYSRSTPHNTNFKIQNIDTLYNRLTSSSLSNDMTYNRSAIAYDKPPNIVVEAPVDSYEPQLTNLDNPTHSITTYHYNNQQCHNYNGTSQNYGNAGMDNGCMA